MTCEWESPCDNPHCFRCRRRVGYQARKLRLFRKTADKVVDPYAVSWWTDAAFLALLAILRSARAMKTKWRRLRCFLGFHEMHAITSEWIGTHIVSTLYRCKHCPYSENRKAR